MSGLNDSFGGLPNESRTVTYMGRQIEVLHPDQWMREHIEQNTAEGLAEHRETEVQAVRDRVIHHMWYPSDNECNIRVLPRWSFERQAFAHEHNLDIDPATGEITNSDNTVPNEEVLFNPESFVVNNSENYGVTTISSIEPSWELSVSDVVTTDKYKEMEKRVEEQDKTIAEMKSIIENLQDIVYQRKLDKEAENLVL